MNQKLGKEKKKKIRQKFMFEETVHSNAHFDEHWASAHISIWGILWQHSFLK